MPETHTVALLGHMQHLRTECGANELSVRRVGYRLEHLRYGRPILSIEVSVDFVEEVEWCRIAGLDGED